VGVLEQVRRRITPSCEVMRIALVHYTKPPVVGGVERVIGDQARALRALGHEVEVVDGSAADKGMLRAWLERGRPRPPSSSRGQARPFTRVRHWQENETSPYLDIQEQVEKHRHGLPHWQQAGKLVFVTWRLADALPQKKLAELREMKVSWEAIHPRPRSAADEMDYEQKFGTQIDRWLDQGMGECFLRQAEARQPVLDTLHHGDGLDYDLVSYVLMPNHVHVLFRLRTGSKLEDVVKAWKSVSSRRMKRLKAGLARIWQEGYWDRLIRGPEHLAEVLSYMRRNPLEARLRDEEWVWWECGAEASGGTRVSGRGPRAQCLHDAV
jgi:putative transposase